MDSTPIFPADGTTQTHTRSPYYVLLVPLLADRHLKASTFITYLKARGVRQSRVYCGTGSLTRPSDWICSAG